MPIWMFGVFTIAGVNNFLDFAKNSRNCKKIIKPKMGTRIHGNTSYELLTTFLQRTMQSGQEIFVHFWIIFV